MIDRHAETVSRWKLVLIVVCLIAIPVSFLWNQADVGSVNNRVTRIESPCQRYGSKSKLCQEAFETAVHSINHRIACYIDHQAGRPFKPSCRGVRLRIEPEEPSRSRRSVPHSEPGAGVMPSEAHPGHSTPGPHGGGGTSGESGSHSPEGVTQPAESKTTERVESTSSSTSESRESVSQTPAESSPSAPVREAVAGTVEEVTGTATGAVEGVQETTCTLAKLLCP